MDKENSRSFNGIACTELQCAVTVENLNSGGEVSKRTCYKKANLSLARNEFRDIVLTMITEKTRPTFIVSNVVLHAKFIKQGKASIVIDNRTRFFLSNCAVDQLVIFLKVLSSKSAKSTQELPPNDRSNVRKRLLSERQKGLTEISPLTLNEKKTTKVCEVPMTPNGSKKMRIENNQLKKCRLDVSRSLTESSLTIEQKMVMNFVLGGRNVFFTGSAGTGKSFLLKKIVRALPPETTFVTASTGVAAMQIGGTTLHSFAGIGLGGANLEVCLKKIKTSNAIQHWKKCQHLIVDEISMVQGDYFVKLDAIARSLRKSDRPFGGIQLIVCGDFLQLPPVASENEKNSFCFETNAWSECIGVNMELKEIHRQRDKKLISILQAIRLGICTKEMSEILLATNKSVIDNKDDIIATHLCTHNEDVDLINRDQLSSLPGESREFIAIDSEPCLSSWLDKQCPVESKLTLKVGTQVMLLKNHDFQKGLVNGSRGIVLKFHEESGFPVVKFKSGHTITVGQIQWTIKGASSELLTRKQLPLKLAWALSIHKAQGMTLDCVKMSLSKVFECGQAYVGLSRASNLTGLRVLDFDRSCVRANPKVLDFYKYLRKPTGI